MAFPLVPTIALVTQGLAMPYPPVPTLHYADSLKFWRHTTFRRHSHWRGLRLQPWTTGFGRRCHLVRFVWNSELSPSRFGISFPSPYMTRVLISWTQYN